MSGAAISSTAKRFCGGLDQAIVRLGDGFLRHRNNTELRRMVRQGEVNEGDLYRWLQCLVFRLVFESGDAGLVWSDQALGPLSTASVDDDSLEEISLHLPTECNAEELGRAYESLLELDLQIDTKQWEVTLCRTEQTDRKSAGSYYTPSVLVERILDWTLEPAIGEALGADEPETALLGLKILDPACGSGHFLTAAADRVGSALATLRTAQPEPSAEEVERARRDVVRCCIYGVDIDPIAVELCKFALSSAPSDQRIRCGDSLLGLTPRQLDRKSVV